MGDRPPLFTTITSAIGTGFLLAQAPIYPLQIGRGGL